MAGEQRTLLMRANRMLGAALVEHNLVKLEDLEAANERLLELAATGQARQATVLGILVNEKKVLREEDVLLHVVDEQGVGLVDLRGYEVPEEVRKEVDTGECWATWSIPYDREEDFYFMATAYYLSPAVRTYWEKKLGGQIIWQATTMEIVAEFLERLDTERGNLAGARPPTAAPFTKPVTAAPFGKPAAPPPPAKPL
jgi:hypothetical protein